MLFGTVLFGTTYFINGGMWQLLPLHKCMFIFYWIMQDNQGGIKTLWTNIDRYIFVHKVWETTFQPYDKSWRKMEWISKLEIWSEDLATFSLFHLPWPPPAYPVCHMSTLGHGHIVGTSNSTCNFDRCWPRTYIDLCKWMYNIFFFWQIQHSQQATLWSDLDNIHASLHEL